jgi:nicotinamidase-related amidase
LLKTWRERHWPVLHVHHDDKDDDSPINAKYPETFKPHAGAKPEGVEPVFVNHVGSPFVPTDLPEAIKVYEKKGKRKVVVIGMDGGQCINSTTRHGASLGYEMAVVADACASYGADNWRTGKPFTAEETHDIAMGTLTGFWKVTSTIDVLKVLGYE